MNTTTSNTSNSLTVDADGVYTPNQFDELLREANESRTAVRDSWVPYFKNFQFSRRVLAVIESKAEAFDYRAAAAQEAGHPVCAKECRTRNTVDAPRAWFIY